MIDLLDTLPVESGWPQLSPRNINDAGQIVGAGTLNGLRRPFLMIPVTPVPAVSELGTVMLAVILTVAVALVSWRGNIPRVPRDLACE